MAIPTGIEGAAAELAIVEETGRSWALDDAPPDGTGASSEPDDPDRDDDPTGPASVNALPMAGHGSRPLEMTEPVVIHHTGVH